MTGNTSRPYLYESKDKWEVPTGVGPASGKKKTNAPSTKRAREHERERAKPMPAKKRNISTQSAGPRAQHYLA